MEFFETILKGSYVIEPRLLSDERGGFMRTFCKREFEHIGHSKEFVQHNQSFNTHQGTIRGMHYQLPPFKETKVVRCIRGAVHDVIVDLREGSPTFLQHFGTELSAQNKKMLYIPDGFAHGFQTLVNETELVYLHTEYFTPSADTGLGYNDPALNIAWPLPVTVVSEKDKNYLPINHTFKGI